MELRVKVWIEDKGELCFGRGRAALLEAIDQTGSISAAARQLGMSYRHAWTMIRTSEKRLGLPLVARSKGGRGGGGAALTDDARRVLKKFRAIDNDFVALARRKQDELKGIVD